MCILEEEVILGKKQSHCFTFGPIWMHFGELSIRYTFGTLIKLKSARITVLQNYAQIQIMICPFTGFFMCEYLFQLPFFNEEG